MSYATDFLSILERAGWYSGRRVDISDYVAGLERANITVHEFACRFLQECHGLWLKQHDESITQTVLIIGDSEWSDIIDESLFQEFSTLVQKSLCPVATQEVSILFLAEDGEFIFFDTQFLSFVRRPSFFHFLSDFFGRFRDVRWEALEN